MTTTPDMIAVGMKMVAALGMVLMVVFLLLLGIRRLTGQRLGSAGGKRIHVIESHYLGVKKTISLVRVPGKVLVLGIAGDRITLLDTLDEGIVDLTAPSEESVSFAPVLSDQLKRLRQGIKERVKR